jgi:hypothetical protein
MSFGDLALKAGWSADRVRAIFQSAKTAPTYDQWPFKDLLKSRIAAADGLAAGGLDFASSFDLGPHICSGCHQKKSRWFTSSQAFGHGEEPASASNEAQPRVPEHARSDRAGSAMFRLPAGSSPWA